MNAKRIHPAPYHQHNGVFRAEAAVIKVSFLTKMRNLGCGKSGCKTTLGCYG
jgi:hypothetical protein